MASGVKLKNINEGTLSLNYSGTSTENNTITVPEVTAKMVTDNTTAYNNDTTSFIANTLASGAIIERGSNANGEYVKFADGTLICTSNYTQSVACTTVLGSLFIGNGDAVSYPHEFISEPKTTVRIWAAATSSIIGGGRPATSTPSAIAFQVLSATSTTQTCTFVYIAFGRWK